MFCEITTTVANDLYHGARVDNVNPDQGAF